MANDQRISELEEKLDKLIYLHGRFELQIDNLTNEIKALRNEENVEVEVKLGKNETSNNEPEVRPRHKPIASELKTDYPTINEDKKPYFWENIDFEKMIGENLANKIGILILVLGIGFGAKYSIDMNYINPTTRIILGYIAGIVTLLFGFRLKKEYHNYSAVLVSGAMAIFYCITYFAYQYYDLFPQNIAFGLMVLFTIFTAFTAIKYDREVIAVIGLVGAYAIPFLLSDGSGSTTILLVYLMIINLGILTVSIFKYWRILFYSAFSFTWIIYFLMVFVRGFAHQNWGISFFFAIVFFVLFYETFIANKFRNNLKFSKWNILFVLLNSFTFYLAGFALLTGENHDDYLGIFTLGNAVVHFIVAFAIYKKGLGDKQLFYLVTGLVLVFITIAIPVQLDGNWITMIWAGLACVVFLIGIKKEIGFFQNAGLILIALASISLLGDWSSNASLYNPRSISVLPILNVQFLTSLIFVVAAGIMTYWFFRNNKKDDVLSGFLSKFKYYLLPTLFLSSLFGTFRSEIQAYFAQIRMATAIKDKIEGNYWDNIYNYSISDFSNVWLSIYTLIFLVLVTLVYRRYFSHLNLRKITVIINSIGILYFLTNGLWHLSELKDQYITPAQSEYFDVSFWHVGIRYIAILACLILLYSTYRIAKNLNTSSFWKNFLSVSGLLSILWILSSEVITWLDIQGFSKSFGLGISILWGVYASFIIGLGILYSNKLLRIVGISLFAITLIKLFFYDIAHLNTISKTTVFIALGVLLLIVSFLYNKYKPNDNSI